MRRRLVPALVLVALAGLGAAGCSGDGGSDSATTTVMPTAAPMPPQGEGPQPTTVLDLSGDTSTEPPIAGLIAVALTPDADRLLTLQNTLDDRIVLRSFPYDPDRRLVPADGRVVLSLEHPFVHSGGGLVVAPDGDAYVTIGAYLRPGEPLGPQNPDGTVLRVPAAQLAADDGPPFVPAEGDVVARGLRNPWRMTRDRDTGDLWIGDVGEGSAEEINRIGADQLDGPAPNFGWPYREGDQEQLTGAPADLELTPPVRGFTRDENVVAIIGGYRYRGEALTGLRGRYLYGDNGSQDIRALDPDDPSAEPLTVGVLPASPTSFGEDPDGELYAIIANGEIYRLDPAEGDDEQVVATPLGRMWVYPPTSSFGEATSLVWEPDGRAMLASGREGLVMRIPVEEPSDEVCALTFEELPQLAYESPEVKERQVGQTLALYAEHADQLPPALQERAAVVVAAYEDFQVTGDAEGWDSAALDQLMRATALERGEHAPAQRAESMVANHVSATCN